MSELLPCPFCGGEAEVTTRDVEPQGDPWYGQNTQTFIVCAKCGACLFDEYFHDGFTDELEAIAAWNRRAQPETRPLTLDELGQLREAQIPVWMGRAKEWIFVASVADAPYAQVWYFNAKGFAQTVLYHHEKFYRNKPKEGNTMRCGATTTTCMARQGDDCMENLITDTPNYPSRVPLTNADRIRSMSDEELARQNVRKRRGYCVWTTSDGREFTSYLGFGGGYRANEDTIALAVQHELDWLRQPVKED